MAWLQSNFPVREWFTLEQATKEILKQTGENISIDDLLHFAYLGLCEICLKVDIDKHNIKLLNQSFSVRNSLIFPNCKKAYSEFLDYDGFYHSPNDHHSLIINKQDNSDFRYVGLIAIDLEFFEDLEYRKDKSSLSVKNGLSLHPTRCHRDREDLDIYCIKTGLERDEKIAIDEFIIFKDELLALSTGGICVLSESSECFQEEIKQIQNVPNLAEELMEKNRYLEQKNKELQNKNDLLSREIADLSKPNIQETLGRAQTENKKNKFIKYLLAVAFNEEVAENPRYHIAEKDSSQGEKYSNGEIQKAFDLKGYTIPVTGKTVASWISGIELEKSH